MSIDQYLIGGIYAAAMVFAFWRGSMAFAIAAVMTCNFVGMTLAGGDLSLMIVIDGITLALLILDGSAMALGLAYCVIGSIIIEAGGKFTGLPFNATSAIVDAIIVPIALIIGWSNGGGGRLDFNVGASRRRLAGRDYSRRVSLVARYHAAFDLAGVGAQEKGLRNGP